MVPLLYIRRGLQAQKLHLLSPYMGHLDSMLLRGPGGGDVQQLQNEVAAVRGMVDAPCIRVRWLTGAVPPVIGVLLQVVPLALGLT